MNIAYKACVQIDDQRSCQIVIRLPQSTIGYTYPELYWCAPTPKGLRYWFLDLLLGRESVASEEVFLHHYVASEELTEETFRAMNLFTCTLRELAETLYEGAQQAEGGTL